MTFTEKLEQYVEWCKELREIDEQYLDKSKTAEKNLKRINMMIPPTEKLIEVLRK